jgi:hypothetical protein
LLLIQGQVSTFLSKGDEMKRSELCFSVVLGLLSFVVHPTTAQTTQPAPEPRPGGFLPGLPAARFFPPGEGLDSVGEEQIIETAYDTLASHVYRSGQGPLRFELADFHTIYRQDFDRALWLELVTLPGGPVIEVDRTEARNDRWGMTGTSYKPSWAERKNPWSWRRRLAGRSVREVLDEMVALDPGWLGVEAITSYSVTVWLGGVSRTYRAAFLWLPVAGRNETRFIAQDLITESLDTALIEKLSPAPLEQILRPATESVPAGLYQAASAESGTCQVYSDSRDRSVTSNDSQGHKNGYHGGGLIANFLCQCSSSCVQTCDASIVSDGCTESGELSTTGIHKVSGKSAIASGSNTCSAGRGCGVKYCPAACQGLTINATILGTGITFTFSESGVWTTDLIINHSCPPCVPVSEGSTIDPGTGSVGGGTSPIVLDLSGDGFSFSDLAGGVRFDLDHDGVAEITSWTLGNDDVFLVLDRNGNGWIDDGSELFGNVTSQPASDDPNGYRALAVFDQAEEGGNGDRRITAADPIFSAVRLWQDRNHDGLSQPGELAALEDSGISSISLDYKESRRRDRYGNVLRYRSSVSLNGRSHTIPSVDVFFLTAN